MSRNTTITPWALETGFWVDNLGDRCVIPHPWVVFLWLSRTGWVEKPAKQRSHLNGLLDSWTSEMCFITSSNVPNTCSHLSHSNCSSELLWASSRSELTDRGRVLSSGRCAMSWCLILTCFSQLSWHPKAFPQTSQRNGFTFSWTIWMCSTRLSSLLNDFLHSWQLKGWFISISSCTSLTWRLRLPFWVNDWLQVEHW